jgi:mannobiose 2-epimerase
MIVTQARLLWFASKLLRTPYAPPGIRAAADHGFEFLRDRLWDRDHGGFFWAIDHGGAAVLDSRKHLYGQSFGLFALSEYHVATGREDALVLAQRLFDLLEAHAHDRTYGGYRELFAADWSDPPAGSASPVGRLTGDLKLMNTHMHVMEALACYVRAGAPPRARERLEEIVAILSQTVIRKHPNGATAGTDRHRRDWTPLLDAQARVSYGHNVESLWLMADALRALDRSTAPYHDLFRSIFDGALAHGWDGVHGGFCESGLPGEPADRREKLWWVQAEGLLSTLEMLKITGERSYADLFAKLWHFVDTVQTDWSYGEWHQVIGADGRRRTRDKGTQWKGCYHNGRALLESIERIRRLA